MSAYTDAEELSAYMDAETLARTARELIDAAASATDKDNALADDCLEAARQAVAIIKDRLVAFGPEARAKARRETRTMFGLPVDESNDAEDKQ